ncbi:MAG: cupin domain-containing protein [Coleofasciculus sp. S288]|nr:cupin domain-containing protein [Coleofasciculus sp. S288]
MQYENFCELAALYALDVLDEPNRCSVEDAIANFPEFETELAEFQAAVAALAYSAPPVPMADNLKERLFQRIGNITSEQDSTTESSSPLLMSVPALKERAADVSWEPYSIPGVAIGNLYVDAEKREIACFVRATGSVRFPNHRHAGSEEIVVLEGDLVIDGTSYGSGEYIHSIPGSVHQPETYSGCLIFLRTSLDDEIII